MGINVDELMEGMVLEKNIIRRDGALIVNKGTTLTPRIIERLRKLSGHINFEGNETTDMDEVKETVEESLRKDTENCLNDFFNNPTEAQVQKIKDNADEIVEKTTQSNDPQYDLNAYAEQENVLVLMLLELHFFQYYYQKFIMIVYELQIRKN